MSSILLISFTNETILSKLKSLSKILQYIDRFYVEDVEMEKILNVRKKIYLFKRVLRQIRMELSGLNVNSGKSFEYMKHYLRIKLFY